ncbi:hypothetical protein STEG23_030267 [Scotinomys teguina]
MTSVPKSPKFLHPHYGKLKEIYENMAPGENKCFAADIISVLAMTVNGCGGTKAEDIHVFPEPSEDVEECEDLTEITSNVQLNSNFLALAQDLDIMVPDDIYNTHLENNRSGGSGSQVDSARMNLASSFVNDFVNAAFGQDKLLTDDGNRWLYKNKGLLCPLA